MKHTFSYPLFHPLPHQLTFIAQPIIFIAPYHSKPQIYKSSGYLTEGNPINTAVKQATEEGKKKFSPSVPISTADTRNKIIQK